jgi:MFS family permease
MSCQPVFGRLLQFYEPKMFYLISLAVFLVGSIVCATSPSSIALVLGRAVAGSGAAGIICGSLAIFGDTAPMRERPRGMAVISALQSVAYLAGPILSGALTDSWLTWRFNFWINLRQYCQYYNIVLPVTLLTSLTRSYWICLICCRLLRRKAVPQPQGQCPLDPKTVGNRSRRRHHPHRQLCVTLPSTAVGRQRAALLIAAGMGVFLGIRPARHLLCSMGDLEKK